MSDNNESKVKDKNKSISRDKVIIRTSIIGILANVFLAAFKAVVGLTSNSIAIVMDAVNNLSDAASSVMSDRRINVPANRSTAVR